MGLKIFHLSLALPQSVHLAEFWYFILFLFFSLLPLRIRANTCPLFLDMEEDFSALLKWHMFILLITSGLRGKVI